MNITCFIYNFGKGFSKMWTSVKIICQYYFIVHWCSRGTVSLLLEHISQRCVTIIYNNISFDNKVFVKIKILLLIESFYSILPMVELVRCPVINKLVFHFIRLFCTKRSSKTAYGSTTNNRVGTSLVWMVEFYPILTIKIYITEIICTFRTTS